MVGATIGLLTLCNLVYLFRVRSRKHALMGQLSPAKNEADPETNTRHPSSWGRLLLAIDAAFKVAAFRWTVPYGRNYVLSFSELFFTLGYLASALIWLLVACAQFRRCT
jgi:ferric-chelate reductase